MSRRKQTKPHHILNDKNGRSNGFVNFQSLAVSQPLTHSATIEKPKRNGDVFPCDRELDFVEKPLENGKKEPSCDYFELGKKLELLKRFNRTERGNGFGSVYSLVVNSNGQTNHNICKATVSNKHKESTGQAEELTSSTSPLPTNEEDPNPKNTDGSVSVTATLETVAIATTQTSNIEPQNEYDSLTLSAGGSEQKRQESKSEEQNCQNAQNFNNNNLDYLTNANKESLGNYLLPYQHLFPATGVSPRALPWLTNKAPCSLPKNTCPYCGAVKGGPADLQRHIRKHTGERPFVCRVESCGKAFKAKRSLQYHQFMNHGIETQNSNIGEKYLEARRRRVLSDHVRSLGTPPSLTTAVQALYMLGTMSGGGSGSQSNVELSSGSSSGPPPPPKLAGNASSGTGAYLPGAPPEGGGKALDQSDSLNNNSPMEIDTNRESPIVTLPHGSGNTQGGVVDMDLAVVDKNANYGAIKANNNNNDKTPTGEPTTSTSTHTEEYSLPTQYSKHEQVENEHARHDSGKRQSPPVDSGDYGGSEGTSPAKVPKYSENDCNGESDKHSEDCEEEDGDRSLEFKCFECNLIYQRYDWLEGHKTTHGSEQPYKCQVCGKGFRVKGRLLCHEKDVHDITVRQVFSSDEHYNLRTRARPVDYSLTRRSFDFDFDEEYPLFGKSETSPIKSEPSHGSLTSPRGTQEPTNYGPYSDVPKSVSDRYETERGGGGYDHKWLENPHVSSSHIKHESGRVPIKAAESLHPAFHKHLLSQVHHHNSKPGSETMEHGRPAPSTDTKPDTEGYYEHQSHVQDEEERRIREAREARGYYEPHASHSPSTSGPRADFPMEPSRERNFSEGSQSLPSTSQERMPSQSSFEEGEIDINTHVVEYPSQFPGLKQRISIKDETILVTKLSGVNIKSGRKVSLYKCHMCNKMYNKMSKLQCHMSIHFERSLSLYVCELCGASFKFRLQLVRHASRVHHTKPYTPPIRRRWHSQSSSAATGEGPLVTSPEDYKTRSPLVTNLESPTEVGAGDQRDQKHDSGSQAPGDEPSHLARASDLAPTTIQDQEVEQERSRHKSDDTELSERGERYHGYPIGSIGSSLASSNPSLHRYLYRRYSGTYVCQYCNKTFFRLFSLQRHEQVHTGVKPCFCKDCGKGFSEPRNLRQHILRYHGEHGSIGEEEGHSIRRLRRPISSGLPRTSQRLAPVTPDMIVEAERLEKEAARQKVSAQPSVTSPPLAYDFSKIPSTYVGHTSLDRSRSFSGGSEPRDPPPVMTPHPPSSALPTSQLKVDTTSPVARHPPSVFGPSPSPVAQMPGPPPPPSPSGHLASQIRQKEKLSEDVVVIIPSDPPLEGGEPSAVTPRSAVSDTPSWPEPGGSDTDSTQSMEVIHSAPVRSIMDYRSMQMRVRERRKGQPVRIPSPSDDREIAHLPPQQQFSPPADRASVIREKLPSPTGPPRSAPPREMVSPPLPSTASIRSMPSPTMPSMASAGMIFPGAHDLSNTTSSMAGLPPGAPPLYLGSMLHPGLLSPSTLPLLRGAAPGLLHPGAPPALDPATALRLGLPSPTAWAAMAESFSPTGSGGGATGAGDPRMPTPYARASSSAGRNSSSLRPRLNVVKIPVRREDACKPTLLPDGRTVYRCTYCSKDFGSFSDINRHMDFHEDIRPYKCKFCDYYARTNSQLKVHMMRHQGIREFLCKLCNYKGVTQSDLNRHMKSQIHMMKMQNECRLCGEGFVSPKNLEKHLAMCKGPKSEDRTPQ